MTSKSVFCEAPQQAAFTLSIDFELLWGTADRPYAGNFHKICELERREVIDRLLDLLEEFDIRATWAIVGSMFQGRDQARASAHNGPAELYFAPELVRRVQRCKVEQDIGSHTFSHIEMDEAKCSKAEAERELANSVREAGKWGIEMKSFVFPRNLVGHVDLLKQYGFGCYRGPEPHWYRNKQRIVRRAGHVLEIALAKTPPSVMPVDEGGICNLPGSMLYTPSFGSRRYVPVWLRVLRARRGLNHAVRRKEVFHLWFHPTDLVCRMDAMLDGLRQIFEHVSRLRASEKLVVRSMGDFAPAATHQVEVMVGRER